jgi:gliding motility-associated-like protein
MKNISLVLLLFCFTISTFAQKETNIWYFGNQAGIDFNSGSPVALLDGQLNTTEGCATIANNEGGLLFYTDGVTVWNKNHAIMLNGTGLKGNGSSTHSAIIVPKPNNLDIYYIFTVDHLAGPNGLQYSEVDMSLDEGQGAVTSNKNILLHTPVSEKVTAIKSSVSNEYWVVSHKWESSEFISYRVSESGIGNTPIISSVGSFIEVPPAPNYNNTPSIGAMKISPNGKKLAVARRYYGVELYDFNSATGVVSNSLNLTNSLPLIINPYGIEFSPDSNLLYAGVGAFYGVFQYNLNAGTNLQIINTAVEVDEGLRNHGQMQLASDGKIYSSSIDKDALDVINFPNVIGLGCGYNRESFFLGGKIARSGLPPFIQSFFFLSENTIIYEETCFGDSTSFKLENTVDSVVWNFGDPVSGINNTSTNLEATHLFSSPGIYEVSVVASVGSQTINETATVTIYTQPIAYPVANQISFDDDGDGLHDFDTSLIESTILNGQTEMEVHYYDSSGIELSSPLPNPLVTDTKTITVKVTNSINTTCIATTDIEFIVNNYDIGFPKFFTPNGDGFNDTWQVQVNGQPQVIKDIFIFNRYGKLLKKLNSTYTGWDGTYNGKTLPSNDYWFSVSLEDGRVFKGHFSLIR